MAFATKKTTKRDQQYNALQTADDHSDSSTEVGDWDTEHAVEPRRRKTLWRRVKSYRWMVDSILLLIIIGLIGEKKWYHHTKKHQKNHQKGHQYELAGDITGFAPKFSQQIVTFKPDPIFAPEDASKFWSNETQQAWLDIVPEGLGYVKVKNPTQYSNLPHPIHDYPNATVFTTSVTHQLHCLYTILDAYNSIKVTPAREINMPWHINHCFEYIRQAIMCAGDVALEGAATSFPGDENGEDRGGSDGWDAKHVCKDYGQVFEYLERETVRHVKWIES